LSLLCDKRRRRKENERERKENETRGIIYRNIRDR
jgi:hypothetical protein